MLLPVHFSPCGNQMFHLLQFERVVQLKKNKTKPLGRARKRYLFIIYNFVRDKNRWSDTDENKNLS